MFELVIVVGALGVVWGAVASVILYALRMWGDIGDKTAARLKGIVSILLILSVYVFVLLLPSLAPIALGGIAFTSLYAVFGSSLVASAVFAGLMIE